MAAALRAAEGGIFFPNPQGGGIFKIFPAKGVYPPTSPYSRPLLIVYFIIRLIVLLNSILCNR